MLTVLAAASGLMAGPDAADTLYRGRLSAPAVHRVMEREKWYYTRTLSGGRDCYDYEIYANVRVKRLNSGGPDVEKLLFSDAGGELVLFRSPYDVEFRYVDAENLENDVKQFCVVGRRT